MKHATETTLKKFEPLLSELDKIAKLKKKKLGVYYLKSKAFLHFHEQEDDLFADVRLNPPDFDRVKVTTNQEQKALVRDVKEHIGAI